MYRRADNGDCRAVYDLICDMEAKQLPYEEFERIFAGQVSDENFYCIIREDPGKSEGAGDSADTKVTAMMNLRFEYQLHHAERICEIMEFVVAPDERNKGVGAEVIAYAKELAKENGCTQIEVACNQLRKDTHRFYEREGMHNFHYKFSKKLVGEDTASNELGR